MSVVDNVLNGVFTATQDFQLTAVKSQWLHFYCVNCFMYQSYRTGNIIVRLYSIREKTSNVHTFKKLLDNRFLLRILSVQKLKTCSHLSNGLL